MMTLLTDTASVTVAFCKCASANVATHVPLATPVATKAALGPVGIDDVTVAIPPHVSDSANPPMYEPSLTVIVCANVAPTPRTSTVAGNAESAPGTGLAVGIGTAIIGAALEPQAVSGARKSKATAFRKKVTTREF